MSDIKVTSAHLERDAYLYIRQSTARQVIENTESTLRQYALRERAVTYGWPLERIHVIDNDLGKSGASAQYRDGFQELVSEVALCKAGIVMGLEVSRLARNSADWHRLLELCAMTGTLILDQDGTYDPTSFNDRLVLGLKGTMSEAELHILKGRMRGGVLNKARRGELEMMPPVGLVYQENGVLSLDPDASVQAVIRLVFDTFEQTGSAFQAVRKMVDDGLRFPCRQRVGEKKGDLTWAVPTHCRVLQVLRNPRYAGAFVYGRSRSRPQPDGRVNVKRLPLAEWQFVFPESHVGYISWDQYLANQQRLTDNSMAFGKQRSSGPVREGPALLQGRVLCGICGAHMTMHTITFEKSCCRSTCVRKTRCVEVAPTLSIEWCGYAIPISSRAAGSDCRSKALGPANNFGVVSGSRKVQSGAGAKRACCLVNIMATKAGAFTGRPKISIF